MLDPTRGPQHHQLKKTRIPQSLQASQGQQRVVPHQYHPSPQYYHHQPHQQQQIFLPPHPFQPQQPPPTVPPPSLPLQQHFPPWHHHPDLPYKSPEPRIRSRSSSVKRRPTLRAGSGGGHPAPEVDVSQTHNGTARRARSRAGSVSFPDRSDMMSPSLEKQMMPHQLSNSGSANYVELCFPAQVNMNGSQPNLASMPINKVDSIKPAPAPDVTGCVSGRAGPNRPMPKSASFDDSQTALDVVRTKRAKQLLTEKSSTKFPTTTRTTKSGLSVERTVGCADLVDLGRDKSKTPTPHHSRPVTPQRSPPPHTLLSPETALPPPPSPPCTCGKVLGDMGPPPPPVETEWDSHSVDSKGTLESRRSQGYVSMTSASTYLIDATGADPVLVQAEMNGRPGYRDSYTDGQMFGYPVDGGLMSHMTSDRIPLCQDSTGMFGNHVSSNPNIAGLRGRWCDRHMKENCGCSLNKSIIKKTSFPRQQNGTCTNGVLKNFSVNSDENERGVTFRVGKFIGQVTIESVKFRRQHWLFLLICLLVFVIILSIYLPIAGRADNVEDPEYRLMVIQQMLREVPLIDGHNDLAWNIRQFIHNKLKTVNFSQDLTQVSPWGTSKWSHTDIPRLVKGKLGAQLWVAYAPCGSQHKDAVQITLEQIDLIKRLIEQYSSTLHYVTSSQGLLAAHQAGKIASVISVESGHSIGTSLAVLRMYYRLGARSLTLTHNCNNPWADSSLVDKEGNQPVHNGLTSFGKTVINEMNRLGMIVDLSHSSIQTAADTLSVSVAPVIFSHSSAQAICNSTRNVPDHLLKLTAEKGGLVMINFFSYFITCSNSSSIADVIAHINHVRDVAGIDYVGIGASYDGINEVPAGLEDVSKYVDLFSALYASGKWTVQVGRRLSGEDGGSEDTIPSEELSNVPGDCKSYSKRNADNSSC